MTTFEYEKIDIERVEGICLESRNVNLPGGNNLHVKDTELSSSQEIIISRFKIGDLEKEEAELLLRSL